MNQSNLHIIDWESIPEPVDDGGTAHLLGASIPDVALISTNGNRVKLGSLKGWNVLYFYPMTGRPDVSLPVGWDQIPGARGCTPQTCAFRDYFQELINVGVSGVYGISTQTNDYQIEAANRLNIPFQLLSDHNLELTSKLNLPTFKVEEEVLIKRVTIISNDLVIKKVFYPIFPPPKNVDDILDYMKNIR